MMRKVIALAILSLSGLAAWISYSDGPRAGPIEDVFWSYDENQVESIFEAMLRCLEEDGGSAQSTPCKARVARNEVARTSPGTATAAIGLGLERRPDLFGPACHAFSHSIGQESAQLLGSIEDLAAVAAMSTDICQFGMYHGLVEGYGDRLGPIRLKEELPRLCGTLSEAGRLGRASIQYAEGECFHVLGHVTARATKDVVPEGLLLCDLLPFDGARTACGTGVIMNWADSVQRWAGEGGEGAPPAYLPVPADQRWLVCLEVPDRYQRPCVLWMGSTTITSLYPDHIRSALAGYAAWCTREFADPEVVESCWMSVGMMGGDLATMRILGGLVKSISLCEEMSPAQFLEACMSQLIGIAVSYLEEDELLTVCSRSGEASLACRTVREMLINSFGPDA